MSSLSGSGGPNSIGIEMVNKISDWMITVRTLSRTHEQASVRSLPIFEQKIAQALTKLPYLGGVTRLRSDEPEFMSHLKCTLKGVTDVQAVLNDFNYLLKNLILTDVKAYVCIAPSSAGFEIRIAVIDSSGHLSTTFLESECRRAA